MTQRAQRRSFPNAIGRPARQASLASVTPIAPPEPAGFSILAAVRAFTHPMSVAELAPILGVSEDVLYRMVRTGKIPQLHLPGRKVTRFDPATIIFWLCKHNPVLHQVQKAS